MVEAVELLYLRDLLLTGLGKLPFGDIFTNKYMFSLLILILFVVLAKLIQLLGTKYLEKIAKKTVTKADDLILEKMKQPIFLVVVALGLKLAVLNIVINGIADKLVSCILALLFLLLLSRGVDIIIELWGIHFAKRTKTKVDEILLPLFHKATKVIFIIVGVLWALHIFGIDITPYLAGVGISGIVLGLALQDSLKNVFGGISLILDDTYRIGDRVQLDSGDVGIIHEVGLRSTKVVTSDNRLIYVPNGYLSNVKVINFSHPVQEIRVYVNFGVVYGTSTEKVKQVVLEAISKMKEVLHNPAPSIEFLEMGDFALKFRAHFWVESWDIAFGQKNGEQKKSEATELIYNALNKAKIGIPFPTQTVYLKKE